VVHMLTIILDDKTHTALGGWVGLMLPKENINTH